MRETLVPEQFGPLQGVREVAAEVVHARAHVVDGAREPVLALGLRASAHEQDHDDDEPDEGNSRDDNADCRSARDVLFPHPSPTAM